MYLPAVLKTNTQAFELFYMHSYGNRNLFWALNEGEAEITFNKHVFVVNTYQAMLCLEFNKALSIKISELKETLKINPKEVDRIIKMYLKLKLFTIEPPLASDAAPLD